MSSSVIAFLVFLSVFSASLLAFFFRCFLPKEHLSNETKDTVKLAMGLVATMAALVLGLLVASAKGSYDTDNTEVTAMAAKIDFLDRILTMYGPESKEARELVRFAVDRMVARLWPDTKLQTAELDPRAASASAEEAYHAIRNLKPQNEEQKELQSQALSIVADLGQTRWLLFEQANATISTPLLVVVVCWLAILFFSFALFAPANGTVIASLLVAALSIAGAIFLVLELDRPFGGIIQVSSQPMLNALNHIGK